MIAEVGCEKIFYLIIA